MGFDLSEVRFSWRDKEKGITIPSEMSEALAEDIGIHMGDGSLYCDKPGQKSFRFSYSGNATEMQYMRHIMELKKKLYNIENYHLSRHGNEMRITFSSLAKCIFYREVLGIPLGSKKDFGVPAIIMDSESVKIKAAFLRGMIDTDFALVLREVANGIYPAIQGTFASRELVIGLQKLFTDLEIRNNIRLDYHCFDKRWNLHYKQSRIQLNGYKRVAKCFNIIGYQNKKYDKRLERMKWAQPDFLENR